METISDDDLQPDIAVEHLELIAFELQQLAPEDRKRFLQHLADEADATEDAEWAEFLRGFGDACGLLEDETE